MIRECFHSAVCHETTAGVLSRTQMFSSEEREDLAPVVQRADNFIQLIQRISCLEYWLDYFHPLDSDLSAG